MGRNEGLRQDAFALQARAEAYNYGDQQYLWCGVPIMRLPDGVLILQEMI